LSDAPVRVASLEGQRQLLYVFSAHVPVPYVTIHLRTPAKLEQAVSAQSTINGSYVVPQTSDMDGVSLTPAKHGLLPALKYKYELLHFGYVTQWETSRRAVYTYQVLCHDDTSLPKQFLFYPRFTSVHCGLVWMLISGYINQLCGQTPTNLRMGTPVPTTSFETASIFLWKPKFYHITQYSQDNPSLEG
jgi:hypothetical protein